METEKSAKQKNKGGLKETVKSLRITERGVANFREIEKMPDAIS